MLLLQFSHLLKGLLHTILPDSLFQITLCPIIMTNQSIFSSKTMLIKLSFILPHPLFPL